MKNWWIVGAGALCTVAMLVLMTKARAGEYSMYEIGAQLSVAGSYCPDLATGGRLGPRLIEGADGVTKTGGLVQQRLDELIAALVWHRRRAGELVTADDILNEMVEEIGKWAMRFEQATLEQKIELCDQVAQAIR